MQKLECGSPGGAKDHRSIMCFQWETGEGGDEVVPFSATEVMEDIERCDHDDTFPRGPNRKRIRFG